MIGVKGLSTRAVYISAAALFLFCLIFGANMYLRKEKAYMPEKTGLQEFYSEKLKMGYYLYIPAKYDAKSKYPLIMHLHGSNAGGNGKNELLKVKNHGLKALVYRASDRNCLILAPQANTQWRDHELDELLDEVTSIYSVDKARIYLTGVSMGGMGTWSYAVNGKHKLAAIVPVCGYFYYPEEVVNKVKDMPIWLFHGDLDQSVPVERAYEAIKKLEGMNEDFKYTILENRDHAIWDDVYLKTELYDWLLNQARHGI